MDINNDNNDMNCNDDFMKLFKYYKNKKLPPSYDCVISLENPCNEIQRFNIDDNQINTQIEFLGLLNPLSWNMVTFFNHPGLIFIRNPFTTLGQRYWIRKCLEEYSRKPNKTNIDVEVYIDDWWAACFNDRECNIKLLKRMRWTTLGYHHNWDTKRYSERDKNLFPQDLSELCKALSKVVGFDEFRAEAAIINYYHMGSTLSAHTDHSEVNLEAPLFSFSFGQSAIFLIGGPDKSIEPSAILLNSGDIIVMSKEARLCYHAVPRILPSSTQPWNEKIDLNYLKDLPHTSKYLEDMKLNIDPGSWDKFSKYVEESRININVRQVLNKNQRSLSDIM